MVKKKSAKPKVKKVAVKLVPKTKSIRVPKMKWYVWALLGLLLVVVGNMTYKYIATKQDVALLDKAEMKMREIEFPGVQKGVIERYCSERSVKFGNPGKPTCGVGLRFEMKYKDDTDYEAQTTQFIGKLQKQSIILLERRVQETSHYYSVGGLANQLDCSLSNVVAADYNNKSQDHVFYLYCQKDFQTKVYPIRD